MTQMKLPPEYPGRFSYETTPDNFESDSQIRPLLGSYRHPH